LQLFRIRLTKPVWNRLACQDAVVPKIVLFRCVTVVNCSHDGEVKTDGRTTGAGAAASRGKQITLKFMSALFTTTTTTSTNGTKVVVGITDPATLTNFLNAVKAQGISQTLE
jgi:hypothetical protein